MIRVHGVSSINVIDFCTAIVSIDLGLRVNTTRKIILTQLIECGPIEPDVQKSMRASLIKIVAHNQHTGYVRLDTSCDLDMVPVNFYTRGVPLTFMGHELIRVQELHKPVVDVCAVLLRMHRINMDPADKVAAV